MMVVSHKAKQYLIIALKVFILILTFGYIYYKLTQNESVVLGHYFQKINLYDTSVIISLFFFLCLANLNWFFEILKWKAIVSSIQNISFATALKQCLASLTVSLATPNRIGEYGAKAYFFDKQNRKNILLLNFFSNAIQMAVTLFFGVLGIIILLQEYKLPFSKIKLAIVVFSLICLVILMFIYKKQNLIIKGLSLSTIFQKFKNLPLKIKVETSLYSLLRYVIFSFLFYNLLHFFNAEIQILTFFPLVFSMYLIVSIIPTIFLFDVVVKGGVAVWIFSLVGISEIAVLYTVLSMWILNFVVPSLLGSYFLFTNNSEPL